MEVRGGGDVADAFAREREVFREGADHDGVVVEREERRDFHVFEVEEAVRLVGDQQDRTAVLFGLFAERVGERGKLFAVVDSAGRVVRRVDDDGARFVAERGAESLDVEREILGEGRDRAELAAEIRDVEAVFDEVGGRAEDFAAGFERGAEHGVQAAGGAAGHDDVRGVDLRGLFLRDLARESGAGVRESGVRHVADGVGLVGGLREIEERCLHFGRRGHVRVAEAEIVDLVVAVFLLEFDARLEHSADPGGMFHVAENFACHDAVHHLPPSFLFSSPTVS